MPDLSAVVVAADQSAAELLLGVLPAEAAVTVVLLTEEAETDVLGPAVAELIAGADVVVLESTQRRRDLAGWLTASLDLPLVWGICEVHDRGDHVVADQVVLGGSHKLVHRLDRGRGLVVLAKPTQSVAAADRTGPTETVKLDPNAERSGVRVLEAPEVRAGGVPLAAARTVISVGRGIGGPDRVALYRELADRIGAALGASRVVVDSGWVPFAHQVGQTGSAVAPEVYVAFGISGAIQHLAGMRTSKTVVAINTDLEAPMCRLADVVIHADAVEVGEALLAKVRAAGL